MAGMTFDAEQVRADCQAIMSRLRLGDGGPTVEEFILRLDALRNDLNQEGSGVSFGFGGRVPGIGRDTLDKLVDLFLDTFDLGSERKEIVGIEKYRGLTVIDDLSETTRGLTIEGCLGDGETVGRLVALLSRTADGREELLPVLVTRHNLAVTAAESESDFEEAESGWDAWSIEE